MKDTPEKTSKETGEAKATPQGQMSSSSGRTGEALSQQSGQRAENAQNSGTPGHQQSKAMSPTNGGRGQSSRSLMHSSHAFPSLWMDNPFGMMRRFSEEMDRIFDEFGMGRMWGPFAGRGQESKQGMWLPQVEMRERDNQLMVCVDLPGLKKDDIQLEITDNALVIQGERRQEFEDTQQGHHRSERSYGSFYRAIPLPEGIDAEQAQANFQDGVLKITLPLPQQEQSRGRRIQVQESGSSSSINPPGESESSSRQQRA